MQVITDEPYAKQQTRFSLYLWVGTLVLLVLLTGLAFLPALQSFTRKYDVITYGYLIVALGAFFISNRASQNRTNYNDNDRRSDHQLEPMIAMLDDRYLLANFAPIPAERKRVRHLLITPANIYVLDFQRQYGLTPVQISEQMTQVRGWLRAEGIDESDLPVEGLYIVIKPEAKLPAKVPEGVAAIRSADLAQTVQRRGNRPGATLGSRRALNAVRVMAGLEDPIDPSAMIEAEAAPRVLPPRKPKRAGGQRKDRSNAFSNNGRVKDDPDLP